MCACFEIVLSTVAYKKSVNVAVQGCTNLKQLHFVWWHHLWVLGMELASCHPSDAKNFEVSDRVFENLWTSGLGCVLDEGLHFLA
jgi:hypothetical protein